VDYRPPSEREVADPDLDTLHENVPPWMIAPLVRWLEPFLSTTNDLGERSRNLDFIEGLEMSGRLHRPIDRRKPVADVNARIEADPSFGIRAIAYTIGTMTIFRTPGHVVTNTRLPALERMLSESGSAWEVTEVDLDDGIEGRKRLILTRLDLAGAKLAISGVRDQNARAGSFLADAWKSIATQDPQPGEAYDKAVKAIEVAAQPVVLPNNTSATLGQIISAMNAKPSKWTFVLGDLDLVIDMMNRVWTNHFRHGTQQHDDNTPQEADAAVHLAIPLVRFFVGGLISGSQPKPG
jgi:hypothetical protein